MRPVLFHNINFTYEDVEQEPASMIQALVNSRKALPGLKRIGEANPSYPFYEKQLTTIQFIEDYIKMYFIGNEPWRRPIITGSYLN